MVEEEDDADVSVFVDDEECNVDEMLLVVDERVELLVEAD
jgi:hypothetical protein